MKQKTMNSIVLLFSLLSSGVFGQTSDKPIEIRLKLIQAISGNSVSYLVLSVSAINHSSRDIYLPGLKAGGYTRGLHLYRKEGEQFKELELLGQLRSGEARPFINRSTPFYHLLWEKSQATMYQQDSLIDVFCKYQQLNSNKWKLPNNQPLLLKAIQELDDYAVYPIEHIFTKPGYYKITFDPLPADSAYSPDRILSYEKIPSVMVQSNVLYYSNIEYALPSKK